MPTNSLVDVALNNLYNETPTPTSKNVPLAPTEQDPLGIVPLLESGANVKLGGLDNVINRGNYSSNIQNIVKK